MPQDIDALLNAYHAQRGTKRAEPDSSSPAASDTGGEDSESFWGGFGGTAGKFLKGGAKGLAGDVVGAGQIARGIGQHIGLGGVMDAIGQSAPAQAFSGWAEAPSQSTAESIGNWAGGALPFMIGGPESLIARGVLSGAVQPTMEGTLQSHGPGALAGGVLGAIPGMGSKGLHILAHMAKAAGYPVPFASKLIPLLNKMQGGSQLKDLAATAQKTAQEAADAAAIVARRGARATKAQTAKAASTAQAAQAAAAAHKTAQFQHRVMQGGIGTLSAGTGQAIGNQGSVYEEDYQPRYRPSSQ